jgi:hypothetical protein
MSVCLPHQDLLESHDPFTCDRQTCELCVESHYRSICRVASYLCHGNVKTGTRQTFGRFIQVQVFAK